MIIQISEIFIFIRAALYEKSLDSLSRIYALYWIDA